MKGENIKTSDELRMEVLCVNLHNYETQRQNARKAEVSSAIVVNDLGRMIASTLKAIGELERKGVSRFEVKDEKEKNPVQAGKKALGTA